MNLKVEIIKLLESLFEEYKKKNYSYEVIKWELDNIVYPQIGSYLASGDLKKDEGIEIFKFCEENLKKFKSE